ncbi:MAG: DUF2993 domain-containing protein [Cyanobacteriota bacterium]|nr:DUF2993 domain-containing protein [Cyanobacteriota bacterium]
MEILTLLFSGLLAGLAPTGLIIDTVAESQIRSNLESVDIVEVRVDNTPNYQAIAGKIDRLRIATRGVQLTPNIRVDTLEIETDPLDVDLQTLRGGGRQSLTALRQPFQAGVRLVLSEADLNAALQSPQVKARIQKALEGVARNLSRGGGNYRLTSAQIDLLENNRLRFEANLRLVGLTPEELERLPAASSQVDVRGLQQRLQQFETRFPEVEATEDVELRSRLSQIDLSQLQVQLAQLQQLNLEDIQAFAIEVQQLQLPADAQIFPQPIAQIDLPGLRARLGLLQQAIAQLQRGENLKANLQQVQQLSGELQQPLANVDLFLASVEQINIENARPFALEAEPLEIAVESGIEVEGASQLRLVEPAAAIDSQPLPPFVLQTLTGGLSSALDLRRLETSGFTVRLLQLEIDENKIDTAAFVRIEPSP